MTLTKEKLQRIIKEELQIVLEKCRKAKSGEAGFYMAIDPGKAMKFTHKKNKKGQTIAKPAEKGEVGVWVSMSAQGKLAVCGAGSKANDKHRIGHNARIQLFAHQLAAQDKRRVP